MISPFEDPKRVGTIMTGKNYLRIVAVLSDVIDMAYMAGVEQAHGDTIVSNNRFKKYRSQLIDWGLDKNNIVNIKSIELQEQMDKVLSEALAFKKNGGKS